jgi:hypothetical protein
MCTYTLHQIHRLTITYMTMFIVRCDILEYMTSKSNQTCHFYHGIYDNIHVNVIFHGCNLKGKHTSFLIIILIIIIHNIRILFS